MSESELTQPVQTDPDSFEHALARLEAIAAQLERNDVPLAESLRLCAEAARLTQYCRAQLSEAEGKLQQLVEMANGQVRLESLDDDFDR